MKPHIPRWALAVGVVLIALAIAASVAIRSYSPLTRDWVVKALEKRYDCRVEMGSFQANLFPPSAVAKDIVFREHGRTDVPPFVTIQTLTIEARLLGLLESPKRVQRVVLQGLRIHIPPRQQDSTSSDAPAAKTKEDRSPFVVSEIVADGTQLEILPRQIGKEPKHFQIKTLTMHSVGVDQPMSFTTILTNFKPPGEIHSTGQFGPWHREEPGDTPVSGKYLFHDADLAVFKGISGTLTSDGAYQGTLDRIAVKGTTRTPNFMITESGHSVDLRTEFQATVDGTNGNTFLNSVQAHFLHSTVLARGGVYGKPGVRGKTVSLDIDVAGSRVEDMLRLAVKSFPSPILGQIHYRAKLTIPPGDRDVIDKMLLAGQFDIGGGRFTNAEFERKLTKLSQVARGVPDGSPGERIYSNLGGHFDLRNGQISFSRLSFGVPGALIALSGSYGIRTESIDFKGNAQLDAKPSEMTRGFKSILLKAVDPFVQHNGVTVIPIRITGTRSEPVFELLFRFQPKQDH